MRDVYRPDQPVKQPEAFLHTDGFHYFLPGVMDPDDVDAIRNLLPEGSPLQAAFSEEGGAFLLGDVLVPVLACDVQHLQVLPAKVPIRNVMVEGVAIRLPDHLARLHAAWEAVSKGVEYNVSSLLKAYAADCAAEMGKLVQTRVMCDLLAGLQGQASTDIRLPRNTVGMSVRTAKLFHDRLSQVCSGAAKLQDVAGLLILVERYPTSGVRSVRWAKIVILEDVPDFQPLFNAEDWNDLGGGDTDGDLGYTAYDGVTRIGKKLNLGRYPELQRCPDGAQSVGLAGRLAAGWQPTSSVQAVDRVLSMCIKELVGPLDYTFHCIARAYAVSCSGSIEQYGPRKRAFREAYRRVFTIYFPIQENVMDARKLDGGLAALYRLASCMQATVAGQAIDAFAFQPFLDDGQMASFQEILDKLGRSLKGTRSTAFGELVAAGRSRDKRIGQLLDRLQLDGGEFLEVLQADAQADTLNHVQQGRKSKPSAKRAVETRATVWVDHAVTCDPAVPGDQLLVLLRSLKVGNTPVFHSVRFLDEETGYRPGRCNTVLALLHPSWLEGNDSQARWRVVVELPAHAPVGRDGHALLQFRGLRARFFRPRFRLQGQDVVTVTLSTVLKECLRDAVQALVGRRGAARKAQSTIERRFKQGLLGSQQLSSYDPEETLSGKLLPSNPLLDLIHRNEFEVEVGSGKLVEVWDRRTTLLNRLAERGFDVLSTSKGRPGTVVTRANQYGVPAYLHALNAFAPYLDAKRRVEPREIRRALPLCYPEPLLVRTQGTKVPEGLQPCLTHLNVAVLNCTGNTFTRQDGTTFCHDTLLATSSAVAKLAVARMEFYARDRRQLEEVITRLQGLNLPASVQLRCESTPLDLSDGLVAEAWLIVLEGDIEDVGKIKAAVGPLKGVMTVLPVRFFGRRTVNGIEIEHEIDLIVPHETVERKKGLDAALYMLAAKAGIETVDPDVPLPEQLHIIQSALAAAGEDQDGIEHVWVRDRDGNEYSLGCCLVGQLPFYRPPQTGFSSFAIRTGERGVKVHAHAMILNGLPYRTPQYAVDAFADLQWVQERVQGLLQLPLAGAIRRDAGTPGQVEEETPDYGYEVLDEIPVQEFEYA